MNANSSNKAGGGFLIFFGVLLLAFLAPTISRLYSGWRANALLDERGRSVPAVLLSVCHQTGGKGGSLTNIRYRFKPE